MKKVLLVVDMQEVCIGENHAKIFQYEEALIDRVNEVCDMQQAVDELNDVLRGES